MPEDTQQDLLAAIEEESRRLARFVSNLLDMTRLEAGELDLCRDWVDLNEVIAAAVGRARRTFASRMIELSMPEHVPLTKGDPILLEQVIFNLLDNAEKYVPRGTPTRVSLQEEGPELVIRVEDDGPGIQATDLLRRAIYHPTVTRVRDKMVINGVCTIINQFSGNTAKANLFTPITRRPLHSAIQAGPAEPSASKMTARAYRGARKARGP